MELRLVQILVPQGVQEDLRELLDGVETIAVWREPALDQERLVRVLLEAGNVEETLDLLEQRFGGLEGFRVLILRVEATLPRVEEPEPEEKPEPAGPRPLVSRESRRRKAARISREELLTALSAGTEPSGLFLATTVLSALVAAVGLMRDNVAVVIGAMVIAPLLAPNMALAFATTLGDFEMMRDALRTNVIGVGTAFVFALGLGFFVPFDPATAEITSRTHLSLADGVLALAAGGAGVLAFTTGVPAGLVGVMVAVALMPPLVVGGLLAGKGELDGAGRALLLLSVNVIAVNLAGVAAFLAQGVRPRTWWEADKARRATRNAMLVWGVLLAVLALLGYYWLRE